MPEDRPTPPPDLVYQSRDKDLPPYERAAAQSELDDFYRRAYPEPGSGGDDYAPSPGTPASTGMLAPRGGVPDAAAAPYVPPTVGDQPIAPELRQGLAAAAASLGLPELEVPALVNEYRRLAATEAEPPPPERVAEQLRSWHGEARGTRILAAARQAVAEAIRRDPSLEDVAGVLGCSAYSITAIGLARLKAKE